MNFFTMTLYRTLERWKGYLLLFDLGKNFGIFEEEVFLEEQKW